MNISETDWSETCWNYDVAFSVTLLQPVVSAHESPPSLGSNQLVETLLLRWLGLESRWWATFGWAASSVRQQQHRGRLTWSRSSRLGRGSVLKVFIKIPRRYQSMVWCILGDFLSWSIHWCIIYQQYLHFRTSLTFVFDPRGKCLDECKGSSVRGFFLNQLRIPMYLHNSKIDKAWLNPFKNSSQDMACASSRVWSSWRGPRCKIWWFRFL